MKVLMLINMTHTHQPLAINPVRAGAIPNWIITVEVQVSSGASSSEEL